MNYRNVFYNNWVKNAQESGQRAFANKKLISESPKNNQQEMSESILMTHKGWTNYPTYLAWIVVSEQCFEIGDYDNGKYDSTLVQNYTENCFEIKAYIKENLDMFYDAFKDDFIEYGIGNINYQEIADELKRVAQEYDSDDKSDEANDDK